MDSHCQAVPSYQLCQSAPSSPRTTTWICVGEEVAVDGPKPKPAIGLRASPPAASAVASLRKFNGGLPGEMAGRLRPGMVPNASGGDDQDGLCAYLSAAGAFLRQVVVPERGIGGAD